MKKIKPKNMELLRQHYPVGWWTLRGTLMCCCDKTYNDCYCCRTGNPIKFAFRIESSETAEKDLNKGMDRAERHYINLRFDRKEIFKKWWQFWKKMMKNP